MSIENREEPVSGTLTITVTQEDIDNALACHPRRCAVADAITRQVKNVRYAMVDAQWIRMTRGEERYMYEIPQEVYAYVAHYDGGDEIQPFSFRLGRRYRINRRLRTDTGKLANRIRNNASYVAKRNGAPTAPAARKAVSKAEASGELPPPGPKGVRGRGGSAARTRVDISRKEADAKLPVDENGARVTTPFATGVVSRPPKLSKTYYRQFGARRMRLNKERFGLPPEIPHSLDLNPPQPPKKKKGK